MQIDWIKFRRESSFWDDLPPLQIRVPWKKIRLAAELILFYIGGPLLFYYGIWNFTFMAVLIVMGALAGFLLYYDKTYPTRYLVNLRAFRRQLPNIFRFFLPTALLMALAVWLYNDSWLVVLPKNHPWLWLFVMIAYPLFSIVPQAILYRAFFIHRYKDLIPNVKALILLSSMLFSFGHIIFHNWLAIALTFIAGLLFTYRYVRTRSLATSVLEHAMYGNWIYTIGMGAYFSHSLAAMFGH